MIFLIANAPSADQSAYVWCGAAARSAWPGLWAVAAALLMGAAYGAAWLRWGRGEKRARIGYFAAGLAVWSLTLSGPLETLALDRLYSAYILQQILIVTVVCPALVAGVAPWMLRPLLGSGLLRRAFGFVTRPGVSFAVFACVFTSIHVPSFCNLVCQVHPFYHAVRLSLFVAGLLLWWPLASPVAEFPRLSQPMQGLYLLGVMLVMTAVGAPVTLAETVLYHFYSGGVHPLGLSPLEDQVLGGLLMWVVQGIILTAAATIIFVRWLSGTQRNLQVPAADSYRPRV
ncbi:MAG TPA: cytochrome c oxidase assembly protein [Candidatus Acidoferrales bacterium]|nr:cytochrome c oxidase assembly protein [Candidatus Acidoferrales bacterium]